MCLRPGGTRREDRGRRHGPVLSPRRSRSLGRRPSSTGAPETRSSLGKDPCNADRSPRTLLRRRRHPRRRWQSDLTSADSLARRRPMEGAGRGADPRWAVAWTRVGYVGALSSCGQRPRRPAQRVRENNDNKDEGLPASCRAAGRVRGGALFRSPSREVARRRACNRLPRLAGQQVCIESTVLCVDARERACAISSTPVGRAMRLPGRFPPPPRLGRSPRAHSQPVYIALAAGLWAFQPAFSTRERTLSQKGPFAFSAVHLFPLPASPLHSGTAPNDHCE